MTIEILDLPIKNGGSFHSYVSSPEGTPFYGWFLMEHPSINGWLGVPWGSPVPGLQALIVPSCLGYPNGKTQVVTPQIWSNLRSKTFRSEQWFLYETNTNQPKDTKTSFNIMNPCACTFHLSELLTARYQCCKRMALHRTMLAKPRPHSLAGMWWISVPLWTWRHREHTTILHHSHMTLSMIG